VRRYKTGDDEYQSLPEFNDLPPERFEGVTSSDPSMCVFNACVTLVLRCVVDVPGVRNTLAELAPLALALRARQVHEPLVRAHVLVRGKLPHDGDARHRGRR
jgi:hypothetical protein